MKLPLREGGGAGKRIGKPGLWIDIIKLTGHDQRCHDRSTVGTAVGAGEQPGFTTQRKTAQCAFSGIVRQTDPPIVDEVRKSAFKL